jgi:ketosteroid isomerase-like protein
VGDGFAEGGDEIGRCDRYSNHARSDERRRLSHDRRRLVAPLIHLLTADYESCSGYLPGECWGRDTSIKVVSNFATSIPDMTFDFKEVLVAGDRVIVRGEVRGTPAGELFGVPHTGKGFRIMAIDIQTIRDGKIARTFHMENWLSALGQLRTK